MKYLLTTLLVVYFCFSGFAQDTTHSLAFKSNRPQKRGYQFYQPDLSYQIWQQYSLIKEANSGNPQAQHELGLRYLLGNDMEPDTAKGAFWLKKAADQNYTPAIFNYGILLFNGWGVKWNPYAAFDLFRKAAKDNMAQAQLLLGLLYSDDLVTPKDLKEAYYWVKKSSDNGYSPAVEYLNKLSKRVPDDIKDSVSSKRQKKHDAKDNPVVSSGLVYIDFDAERDTLKDITYDELLQDLVNSPTKDLASFVKKDSLKGLYFDEQKLKQLNEAAQYGSPEALTLMGWFCENGKVLKKDVIQAAEFYTRGVETDSRKSAFLLWKFLGKRGIIEQIKLASDEGNAEASSVWYSLYKLQLDRRFTEKDAVNLLDKAVGKNYPPALVSKGLNLINGTFVKQDKVQGIFYWNKAAELGNIEAKIRLETYKLLDDSSDKDNAEAVSFLTDASEKGSVLSEAALANYYFRINDITKSVSYLRSAAMKGNNYAYDKLKELYSQFKPLKKVQE